MLTPIGWVVGDVEIAAGRIVSGPADVGMGVGPGGRPGCDDQGTVGAGAERAAVAPSHDVHAGSVTGGQPPVTGGVPPAHEVEAVEVVDARGLRVVPGYVELQCNGAAGVDLSREPERLWEAAAALPRQGVTAWLPTVVSSPPDVRRRALATLRAGPPPGSLPAPGAVPLGLHLEGPFLAPERRGAHRAEHLAPPDPAVVAGEAWAPAGPGVPGVALVTLAPELPGALAVVAALVERGIAVSAGHSSATAAQARAGFAAGIGYVTHLFNAMAPLHHRAPGLVGAALADDRVRVGLIADGVHVDPAVVAVVARVLGPRLSLVSDAVAGASRLPDGTLAGGTVGLDGAVRNLVAFAGVPLAAAVAAVTTTPAALLGLADRGALVPGARGDAVVLDPAGAVVATVIGGRSVWRRGDVDAGEG